MNKIVKTFRKVFMAFGQAQESKESGSGGGNFKRVIGLAPVYVVGVNPTKIEWEKLYGTTREGDITYIGENEINGVKYPQIRIDFIVKTDPEKCNGLEITDRMSYFLTNSANISKDGNKIQMVNVYGEFAYIPKENAKNNTVPDNMSWFNTKGMRPAFVGEEALTGFLRDYLCISNRQKYDANTQSFKDIENLSEAEARLDYIAKYFTGDVSEVKSLINMQPMNKVKVVFGIKTTSEGKVYSDIYTRRVLRLYANESSVKKLTDEIKDSKEKGAYPNTIFETTPLKEFEQETTQFENKPWETPVQTVGSFFNTGAPQI